MLSYDSYGARSCSVVCVRRRQTGLPAPSVRVCRIHVTGALYFRSSVPRPGGRRRDLFVTLCFHCRFPSIAFGTWKRENERISVVRRRVHHRGRPYRRVTSVITPPSPRRVAVAVTDVFVYVSADHR